MNEDTDYLWALRNATDAEFARIWNATMHSMTEILGERLAERLKQYIGRERTPEVEQEIGRVTNDVLRDLHGGFNVNVA